jgi:hypothetical protein
MLLAASLMDYGITFVFAILPRMVLGALTIDASDFPAARRGGGMMRKPDRTASGTSMPVPRQPSGSLRKTGIRTAAEATAGRKTRLLPGLPVLRRRQVS